MKFDLRQTNIAKGIALLLLLWHHVFFDRESTYELYTSLLWIKDVPVESRIAVFCKVCVAMFMFLSGYGLYKSYNKSVKESNLKSNIVFVKNRLVKLLAPYWVVFIIFVPMGLAFGRSFFEIYGSNPLHYITDFFGLSYLFYGMRYTMNVTWWYMSVIIVYYLLYPALNRLLKYSSELLLAIALLILFVPVDFREYTIWIMPFVLGIYASEKNIFERLDKILDSNIKKFAFTSVMLLVSVIIRYFYYRNKCNGDFIFSFFIILLSYFFISKIPVISKILEELGKKSGLIFMFHTFIFSLYFKEFIYSFKYSPVIYIVLLAVCYAVAWLITKLMQLTGYTKLIKKITSKG